jgi:two-component system, OmpR family, phosphate regulon sensor histidine kinase PhoR
MNRRLWKFRLIIILIAIALLGLLGVQVYLLNSALQLKEQALYRNALTALNTVARKLESAETLDQIFNYSVNFTAPDSAWGKRVRMTTDVKTITSTGYDESGKRQSVFRFQNGPRALSQEKNPIRYSGDTIYYWVDRAQRVTLRMHDPGKNHDTVLVDAYKPRGKFSVKVSHGSGNSYFYKYTADSAVYNLQIGTSSNKQVVAVPTTETGKEALVKGVVGRLLVLEHEPIERRIDSTMLDSLLRNTLRDTGIPLHYAYGVVTASDSLFKLTPRPAEYREELRGSELRARLFPTDLLSPRHDLVLYFPTTGTFLWQQIWLQLAATVLFMGIIIFSFIYTIRTIIEQQRVALLMTDFINNMTHEFKTPLSTVALAVEAIQRPDVISRREKIRRYSDIIVEENGRMRKQVDKILQMAVLERGEYELHPVTVDAHELVTKAIEGIALQVEEKKGTVTCSFEARNSAVNVDPLHFANVINNLLDNANKYSPEVPRILVSTHNEDGTLVIRITDNGIGISAEDLPKVFDKYYRVPTGNRHDVKGFGLGLSYVKLLVTAMGGRVGLSSRQGEGTTAEVVILTENREPRVEN